MMKNASYKKITIKDFAKKVHSNAITEMEGLAISRNSTSKEEYRLDLSSPYILEGIVIMFCLEGSGKIKINLNTIDVVKNTIIIATPNFIIQSIEQSEDIRIGFIFFTFDFISEIKMPIPLHDVAKTFEQRASLVLNNSEFEDLLTMHRLIVRQFDSPADLREHVIKSLLYSIVYKTLQLYSLKNSTDTEKPISRYEIIYSQFISLLFEHYKTERSMNFYAEQLHLTPKYFSKMIKQVNGLSATEWIDEMVVMGAKAMLKSTSLSIAQISDELNFANPSFFGTYFKKKTKMTPLEYRQE